MIEVVFASSRRVFPLGGFESQKDTFGLVTGKRRVRDNNELNAKARMLAGEVAIQVRDRTDGALALIRIRQPNVLSRF